MVELSRFSRFKRCGNGVIWAADGLSRVVRVGREAGPAGLRGLLKSPPRRAGQAPPPCVLPCSIPAAAYSWLLWWVEICVGGVWGAWGGMGSGFPFLGNEVAANSDFLKAALKLYPKKVASRPSGRQRFPSHKGNLKFYLTPSSFLSSSNPLPISPPVKRMNLPVHPVSFPCSRFPHQQSFLCTIQKAFLRLPKANLVPFFNFPKFP